MKKVQNAISKAKDILILRAKEKGLYENFGQAEILQLKEKFEYNPYGTLEERSDARLIDEFECWCCNFTGGTK